MKLPEARQGLSGGLAGRSDQIGGQRVQPDVGVLGPAGQHRERDVSVDPVEADQETLACSMIGWVANRRHSPTTSCTKSARSALVRSALPRVNRDGLDRARPLSANVDLLRPRTAYGKLPRTTESRPKPWRWRPAACSETV